MSGREPWKGRIRGGGRGRGDAPPPPAGRGRGRGRGRGGAPPPGRGGAPWREHEGGLSLHSFLQSTAPLTAVAAQERFVKAVVREGQDANRLLSALGSPEGLARLQQLVQTVESVAASPPGFLSTWLPLLGAVSAPSFAQSVLASRSTPVYATLATPSVFAAIATCLPLLAADGAVPLDTLLPCALFARKAVGLDRSLALQPSFCALTDALQRLVEASASLAPAHRAVREAIRSAAAPVAAAREAEAAASQRAAADEARAARERIFPEPRAAGGVAGAAPPEEEEGPGGRHDNDWADFRRIQVGPTEAEILCPRPPYLPENSADFHFHRHGADALLDTHFRLLRHDLLAPLLRSADALQMAAAGLRGNRLAAARGDKEAADLFALRRMRVVSFTSVSAGPKAGKRMGLYYVVEFDQPGGSTRKLDEYWTASKRLAKGALVCVWLPRPGLPPRLVFATVTERSLDDNPVGLLCHSTTRARLGIAPCGAVFNETLMALAAAQDDQGGAECLLLEASADFFAYEPVLRALQQASSATLPFQAHLLHRTTDAPLPPMLQPAYLAALGEVDLSLLARPGAPAAALAALRLARLSAFPFDALREASSLDQEQMEAVAAALGSELALIQGPPGTGKTFVGVQIMRLLLNERRGDGPILVICYTNHALDQFLEALLASRCFGADAPASCMVRVGGRSKSEKLEPHNLLSLVRGNDGRSGSQGAMLYKAFDEVRACDTAMQALLAAAVGGVEALKWRDMDDYLCLEYPAVWAAFNSDRKAGFKTVYDEFQFWLRERERLEMAARAAAAADARAADEAAAALAAAGGHFAALADEGAATKKLPKPPPPPPLPPPEIVSNERLNELLQLAKTGPLFDLWSLSTGERRALSLAWLADLRRVKQADLERVILRYEEAQRSVEEVQADIKLNTLRRARVVGMTTTGVAQNQALMAALGPRVVIAEEAAEVMEAHLLSALSPATQHLILIGDHKQLRPKASEYTLSVESGRGFNLDLSLFERLASMRPSSVPIVTLATQRRMRPQIAQLVRATIYPELRDDPSVAAYPGVRGMRDPIFFIDHQHPESGEEELGGAQSGSKQNAGEAAQVVALTKYLLHQGYKSHEIAVITPYVGQLKRLRRLLSAVTMVFVDERDAELMAGDSDEDSEEKPAAAAAPRVLGSAKLSERVRLATIDNFQGEEAEVVIISLVRNNKANRVGFVATPNRANVLLSRAKHGMYIFGNERTFRACRKGGMWDQVLTILTASSAVGPELALVCPNHPETVTMVSSPADFETLVGDGGCALECSFRLPCGHTCPRRCHPDDRQHNAGVCYKPCQRGLPCGHACPELCYRKCPPCAVPVDAVLPACSHQAVVPCSRLSQLDGVACRVPVSVTAAGCGHTVNTSCSSGRELTVGKGRCPAVCGESLQTCGHRCRRTCAECRSEDGPFRLPGAAHKPCTSPCDRNLSCGHGCQVVCHSSATCPPCSRSCAVACVHSRCSLPCAEPCAPCAEECRWACAHQGACNMPCGAPCDRLPCNLRCELLMACGHRCPSLCGERCPGPAYCRECGISPAMAAYQVDVVMGATLAEHDPDESPLLVLPCGHALTVESMDGLYEMPAVGLAPLSLSELEGQSKSCPYCRAPATGLMRYGRLANHAAAVDAERKFLARCSARLVDATALLSKAQDASLAEVAANGHVAAAAQAAMRAFASIETEASPLKKVYLACLAAAHRQEMPKPTLPIPTPDVTLRCRALEGLGKSQSVLMCTLTTAACRGSAQADGDHGGTGGRGAGLGRREPAPEVSLTAVLRAGEDAAASLERALTLAEQGNELHLSVARARIALAGHLAQVLSARLRIRSEAPAERGGGISAQWNDEAFRAELVAQYVRRPAALAQAVLDDAAGRYEHSSPQLLTEARELLSRLPRLEEATKYVISDAEIQMVFQAMGMHNQGYGQGHWFQCPNRHPYFIGDCGGAVMVSACPECGARVGGDGHRLLSDNRVATEFLNRAVG